MGAKYPEEEREVIRKHYATLGPSGVHKLLPHVSRAAIADRAKRLGLLYYTKHESISVRLAKIRPAQAIEEADEDVVIRGHRTQQDWITRCRPVVPAGAARWVFDLGYL